MSGELTGLSKNTGDVTLHYEDPKWSVRLEGNYRSAYLIRVPGQETGTDADGYDATFNLNASLQYNLTKHFRMMLEGNNLTGQYENEFDDTSRDLRVTADGREYGMKPRDGLYVGKGSSSVVFESADSAIPAKYYLVSAPAHARFETVKIAIDEAMPTRTGALETCNQRTIYQYVHPDVCRSSPRKLAALPCGQPAGVWIFGAGKGDEGIAHHRCHPQRPRRGADSRAHQVHRRIQVAEDRRDVEPMRRADPRPMIETLAMTAPCPKAG